MQILGYHNHNFFCDGEKTPEAYLQEAVRQSFRAFGFSSHAPFNFFNKWSVSFENLNKYLEEIDFLKRKYSPFLRVFKALEIDYAPHHIKDFNFFREKYGLDYIIGSIHYLVHPRTKDLLFIDGSAEVFKKSLNKIFGNNVRYAIEVYYAQTIEMLQSQRPDIIGHPDKIIMNTADLIMKDGRYPPWYERMVKDVAEEAAASNVIMELNMRGLIKGRWHTSFIDEKFIPVCSKAGVSFVVSTDAHKPSEIGMFYSYGTEMLKKAGINSIKELTAEGWCDMPLT